MSPRSRLGVPALILASALWGVMYVATDSLMAHSPPLVILEIREIISSIILVAIAWRKKSLSMARKDWKLGIATGVVGFAISIGFQFYGTHLAGAALGSLITASSPILIAVLGALLLAERVPRRRWIAIFVAFGGVILIVGTPAKGAGVTLGIFLLIVAAVTWAVYTVLSARLVTRYSSLTVVTWSSVTGMIVVLPFATLAATHSTHPIPTTLFGWEEMFYISVIGMAFAFFCWVWGFKSVSASRGGVLLLFQPLVGVILGVMLLSEHVTAGTIVGGFIVAVGVVLAVWEKTPLAAPVTLEP